MNKDLQEKITLNAIIEDLNTKIYINVHIVMKLSNGMM